MESHSSSWGGYDHRNHGGRIGEARGDGEERNKNFPLISLYGSVSQKDREKKRNKVETTYGIA